jgi:acyl-CoA synthetase (AMP-forming)/AMP-acid ligase II
VTTTIGTLVDLLRARAAGSPGGYTFLGDGEEESGRLSFADLDARARAIGRRLAERGMAGERALLLYPPGLEFIAAFFGCLYAGVVAVPAYPPRQNRSLLRLRAIAAAARPRFLLTTEALLPRAVSWGRDLAELAAAEGLSTDSIAPAEDDAWRPPRITAASLAFLQYTSGSTAEPKGV